ncbi:hypothetical protein Tsubulata_046051 [Turnera subulata]|uniref:Crossover junction endonuclease MUS81 n=1 Tax=Turnera subulata TaxID=218843 RepID=A0A9Q0G3U7_9ROSI|nr:hypothetical protein Tsubulata_046051 [Turnera subulata]
MESGKRVLCPENEGLAVYMLQKMQELAEKPKGLSENVEMTLSKAYGSICSAKAPIATLKDLSRIRGVGKWILKLMQRYFDDGSGNSEPEDLTRKGKRAKGTKRYLPQKNSVAYALLVTLYREAANGTEFMRKQELIDAAEASGLSRVPIGPEKGKGKPSQFGSSAKDWYTGWSCMKTLINKGLVVKSSCPAKYMLTGEGLDAARECLTRSHLEDPKNILVNGQRSYDIDMHSVPDVDTTFHDSTREVAPSSVDLSRKESIDVPHESLEMVMRLGYSKEQVLGAFTEVSETSRSKEISSLWPAVLCHLCEKQVYGGEDVSVVQSNYTNNCCVRKSTLNRCSTSIPGPFTDYPVKSACLDGLLPSVNTLSMPPLSLGERFEDVYDVILILDDREQFAVRSSKGGKLIEYICKEYKIKIQVRRLPVGDGIWIARHKYLHTEYVLDFIVERKKVDDLRSSIRDNRYRDQKLRLLRCGLKKLIYLVEGDPNSLEAAESIKTAYHSLFPCSGIWGCIVRSALENMLETDCCFTTEILEGFDVQRTSCLRDTLKKYGYLTQSITQFYRSQQAVQQPKISAVSPPLDEFIQRCQELEKMTVSDAFAIQLMQVPQVTEEAALAVLDLYPTLISLALAYSHLDGDVCAQEEMLRKQSNNVISAGASRNIFQLVWGDDR